MSSVWARAGSCSGPDDVLTSHGASVGRDRRAFPQGSPSERWTALLGGPALSPARPSPTSTAPGRHLATPRAGGDAAHSVHPLHGEKLRPGRGCHGARSCRPGGAPPERPDHDPLATRRATPGSAPPGRRSLRLLAPGLPPSTAPRLLTWVWGSQPESAGSGRGGRCRGAAPITTEPTSVEPAGRLWVKPTALLSKHE